MDRGIVLAIVQPRGLVGAATGADAARGVGAAAGTVSGDGCVWPGPRCTRALSLCGASALRVRLPCDWVLCLVLAIAIWCLRVLPVGAALPRAFAIVGTLRRGLAGGGHATQPHLSAVRHRRRRQSGVAGRRGSHRRRGWRCGGARHRCQGRNSDFGGSFPRGIAPFPGQL